MHRMTAGPGRLRADERGGVVLVVILMMAASMLVLVTVNSVSSNLNRVTDDQTRSNAFQHANAGVDQALYRIEKRPLSTTPSSNSGFTYTPGPLDSEGKVTMFTETFLKDGVDYVIKAEQTPPGQDTVWRVNSTGRDIASGKTRQAVANIRASSLFENGMFTENEFYITGNQFNKTTPVAYNSALCPNPMAVALTNPPPPNDSQPCNLSHPVQARLGSNKGFPVNSSPSLVAMIDQWAGFAVYGVGSVEDAQALCGNNTKCHTLDSTNAPARKGNVIARPERLTYQMPKPDGWSPCPNGGRLGSKVNPPVPSLAGGSKYRCARLTIQGELAVTGTGDVQIYVDNELSIVPGKKNAPTRVNAGQRPRRFQVYLPQGATGKSQICGSEIWALLYTPGLDIDCHGAGQTKIFGAVVAGSYSGTGNQFAFHWDATASDAVHNGKYHVYNWRECPVGTDDC